MKKFWKRRNKALQAVFLAALIAVAGIISPAGAVMGMEVDSKDADLEVDSKDSDLDDSGSQDADTLEDDAYLNDPQNPEIGRASCRERV